MKPSTDFEKWLEAAARDYAANAEIKDESMSEGIGLNRQQKLCAEYGFREGATQALQSPVVLALVKEIEYFEKVAQGQFHQQVCLQSRGCHCRDYPNAALTAYTTATQASKANEEKGGE